MSITAKPFIFPMVTDPIVSPNQPNTETDNKVAEKVAPIGSEREKALMKEKKSRSEKYKMRSGSQGSDQTGVSDSSIEPAVLGSRLIESIKANNIEADGIGIDARKDTAAARLYWSDEAHGRIAEDGQDVKPVSTHLQRFRSLRLS